MRYRLRTLLILLAVLPPLIWFGWGKYQAWRAERLKALREAEVIEALRKATSYSLTVPPVEGGYYQNPLATPPATPPIDHGGSP